MIFLNNYKTLLQDKFTIFYNEKNIVVSEEKYATFLNKKDVTYILEDVQVNKNEVLDTLWKQSDLPKKLKKFIKARTRNLIGHTVQLVTDKNKDGTFCTNKKMASLYGIDEPIEVAYKVISTFDNKKDFDSSFDDNESGKMIFGIWDIEEDNISSSFIFGHPVQTKMCFGDFGTNELSKGSLFVKMKLDDKN